MTIFGFQPIGRFLRLRSKGLFAQAVIFDRWEKIDSEGITYYVAYAFKVSSPETGKKIISNAQQSIQAYKKLKIGEKVRVRFLPDNPQICQMTDFYW